MKTTFRNSIACKILIIVLGLYFTVSVVQDIYYLVTEYHMQKQYIQNMFNHIQNAFDNTLADSIWKYDQKSFTASTHGLVQIPMVKGIKITDKENKLLAIGGLISEKGTPKEYPIKANVLGVKEYNYKPLKNYKFEVFKHSKNLIYKEKNKKYIVGTITLYSSGDIIYTHMKTIIITTLLNIILTILAFGLALFWTVKKYLQKPLRELTEATHSIKLDNLYPVELKSTSGKKSEIKELENAFNEMIRNLGSAVSKKDTAEKKLQQELKNSETLRIAAEGANELKTAFLASLSHEIRTPMNGILGFSQLLEDEKTSKEEQDEYIKAIQQSGKRMLNIINDLVDISKIESNQLEILKEETCINDIMNEQLLFFQPKAKAKNIELTCSCPLADEKTILDIDKNKISQVISNLITNAIKFTSAGSISFGYTQKENQIVFHVKDTGIGIDKKHHEMIFERFRQVDIKYSKKYQGSGLGLSISKAFIEKHGGKIWVESQLDQGSAFYFSIPYTPMTAIKTKDTKLSAIYHFNKASKILIAEDDNTNYLLLEKMLKKQNLTPIRAENGQKAVNTIQNNPEIDVILMDIQMPVMNGLEATKKITEINPKIPIIAQSAFVTDSDISIMMNAGCADFIKKPIEKKMLFSTLHKYID